MTPKEVIFEGHKCLQFDNGVICGKGKMRAVLANAEFCKTWLAQNTSSQQAELSAMFAKLTPDTLNLLRTLLKK